MRSGAASAAPGSADPATRRPRTEVRRRLDARGLRRRHPLDLGELGEQLGRCRPGPSRSCRRTAGRRPGPRPLRPGGGARPASRPRPRGRAPGPPRARRRDPGRRPPRGWSPARPGRGPGCTRRPGPAAPPPPAGRRRRPSPRGPRRRALAAVAGIGEPADGPAAGRPRPRGGPRRPACGADRRPAPPRAGRRPTPASPAPARPPASRPPAAGPAASSPRPPADDPPSGGPIPRAPAPSMIRPATWHRVTSWPMLLSRSTSRPRPTRRLPTTSGGAATARAG